MATNLLSVIARVDGHGFKQLINFLEPGWKVPSCTHATSICHKSAVKEQLLTSLSTVQFVAVTFGQAGQHKSQKSNQKYPCRKVLDMMLLALFACKLARVGLDD